MIRYMPAHYLLFACTVQITIWGCVIGYSLTDRIHGLEGSGHPRGSTLVYIHVQLWCG